MKKIILIILLLVMLIPMTIKAEEQDWIAKLSILEITKPYLKAGAYWDLKDNIIFDGFDLSMCNLDFKLKYDYKIYIDFGYMENRNLGIYSLPFGLDTTLDTPFKILDEILNLIGMKANFGYAEFLSLFKIGVFFSYDLKKEIDLLKPNRIGLKLVLLDAKF